MEKPFASDSIRNVAVVGHSSTGKTSLIAAMLFDAKETPKLGKVDKGTTITDFDDEAIERKITIATAAAFARYNNVKINLLDTPGYGIFLTEALQGLAVSEAALLIVSAVAGVEVQTEKLWKICSETGKPVMVLVNLMDRERASAERTVAQLQKRFGRAVVPVQLPMGEETNFSGVVDLLTMQALTFPADESGAYQLQALPDSLVSAAEQARSQLIEMVAEQDEALLEKFFAEGTLGPEELAAGLKQAFRTRKLFPVFFASAARNQGIQPVMDALVELVPSPKEAEYTFLRDDGEAVRQKLMEDGPALAYVFKTISDPYAGRISLFRVFSGSLHADSQYQNKTREVAERFGSVNWVQGKELLPVEKLVAGDIGAVAKLKESKTGDTLAAKEAVFRVPPVRIPEPAIAFAITPKSKGDEDKIAGALSKLQDEDPSLQVSRDAQTKELLLAGSAQLHVEIAVAKLAKRYKVEVTLQPPKVPYRETITKAAEVTTRHKKQTGGHGQFAEAKIRLEPLPRGGGYEFVDKIFGGAISQNYRPSVDKGIQYAAQMGPLAGYPVVDFRVVLLDGKEHPVDSSDMAFQICGRKAFREAVKLAGPTLLEPIMQVEITTPDEFLGDIMGDLNSRRGRVQGMEPADGQTVVKAQVPLAEMLTYSQALRSITGGRGDFHMEFVHYDEVPKQLQEKIVAAAGAVAGEEEEEE